MNKLFLPLSFQKANELHNLLRQIIKANRYKYEEKIQALKLDKELSDYIIIGNLNDADCCYPLIEPNLQEWLREFLEDCYVLAQNQLAS
jgi:hypothetical protein